LALPVGSKVRFIRAQPLYVGSDDHTLSTDIVK
jgi:hypothetical protein